LKSRTNSKDFTITSDFETNKRELLRAGCYLLRFIPKNNDPINNHYDGTLRIQCFNGSIISSGDLYKHTISVTNSIDENKEPNPSKGISIFPIKNYVFYMRVININGSIDNNIIEIEFEFWRFLFYKVKEGI
jgi:uncharacterized protein YegP (UPF0339 family)